MPTSTMPKSGSMKTIESLEWKCLWLSERVFSSFITLLPATDCSRASCRVWEFEFVALMEIFFTNA